MVSRIVGGGLVRNYDYDSVTSKWRETTDFRPPPLALTFGGWGMPKTLMGHWIDD